VDELVLRYRSNSSSSSSIGSGDGMRITSSPLFFGGFEGPTRADPGCGVRICRPSSGVRQLTAELSPQ
jgi:hypothetical protein